MDKQREQEKESIGKKMVELMKLRDKRKAKERVKKSLWSLLGRVIGSVVIDWIIFKWVYADMFEKYPTVSKWVTLIPHKQWQLFVC